MNNDRIARLLSEVKIEIFGDDENTSKDKILTLKIKQANAIGFNILYPFKKIKRPLEMPDMYDDWLVMASVELYRKIGDENIKSYAENGLSYTYGTASLLSDELQTMLVPVAGVPIVKEEIKDEEKIDESEL